MGGIEHGRTDEYSYNIIDQNGQRTTRFEDDAVHVNDLNATILNQLGIDHRRLSFRFQGLDQRLTGVYDYTENSTFLAGRRRNQGGHRARPDGRIQLQAVKHRG